LGFAQGLSLFPSKAIQNQSQAIPKDNQSKDKPSKAKASKAKTSKD
jgi:hypothetical protein